MDTAGGPRGNSSDWPRSSGLDAVLELVHTSPASRLPQHELAHFEKVLQASDATTDSLFQARKRQRQDAADSPCAIGPPTDKPRVSLSLSESDDEEEEVLKTDCTDVCALCYKCSHTIVALVFWICSIVWVATPGEIHDGAGCHLSGFTN